MPPDPQPARACIVPRSDPQALAELEPLLEALRSREAITEARRFPRGTLLPDGRLDLCKQGLGAEGTRLVMAALHGNTFVTSVLLGADAIGNEGARAVASELASNTALTTVFLGCNRIDAEGAKAIASAVERHATIRGLWLKRNALGEEGIIALAEALRSNSSLRTLDLAQVKMTTRAGEHLSRVLAEDNASVERLYLSGNALALADVPWIARIITGAPALTALFLSANRLGDDGVLALAPALGANRRLRELTLGSNGLSERGLSALLEALRDHGALARLEVTHAPSALHSGALPDTFGRGLIRRSASLPDDVAAIRSVYRVPKKEVKAPRREKARREPIALAPEELATCARVLETLAEQPQQFFDRSAGLGRVRSAANRVIAAIQSESDTRRRERSTHDRRTAIEKQRTHDRALIENTGIRRARSDRAREDVSAALIKARRCYICKQRYQEVHAFYDALCPSCAAVNLVKREQSAELEGRVMLLTGGRIKIGYQIALKLLRAKARLVVTTRYPHDAFRRFSAEPDFAFFRDALSIHGLDLRDLRAVERFTDELHRELPRLDALINNAAQTVRRPPELDLHERALDLREVNSWRLELGEISTVEVLETHLINAIAPFVLLNRLLPLIDRTPGQRYIVNVSAMEGKFDYPAKQRRHPHTNMAKASLNMLTRTAAPALAERGIFITSVDTGWITNENPHAITADMRERMSFEPPLDELDGAARVLDPIFSACGPNARAQHGVFLKDYLPVTW